MTTETIDKTAPDISCDHCVSAIKRSLGELDGVTSVEADVDTKRVIVSYDADKVDAAKINDVLNEEGYPLS